MGCVASTEKRAVAKCSCCTENQAVRELVKANSQNTAKSPDFDIHKPQVGRYNAQQRRKSSFSNPPEEEKAEEKEEDTILVKCVLCKKEVKLSELFGGQAAAAKCTSFADVVDQTRSKTRCCKACMEKILNKAENEANEAIANMQAERKRKQEEEDKKKEADFEKRMKEIKREERQAKLYRAMERLHKGNEGRSVGMQTAANRMQKGNFRYI